MSSKTKGAFYNSKNIMSTILSKIFSSAAKGVVDSIGNVLDQNITSKEEKLKAYEAITKLVNDSILDLFKMQADIVKTEMQGNWMQRSWRPIIMLSFGWIILYYYFVSQVFSLPKIELPTEFWELLKIGLGGYIIGRSAEKIIKDSPDIFRRKK